MEAPRIMKQGNGLTVKAAAGFKKAELLASVGAGVLGAGIALLFAAVLAPFAVAILVAGLLAHAWGMYQKHLLERHAMLAKVWWAEILYWFCWLALAALVVWIAVSRLWVPG